jgi:hypothetical protein
MGNFYKLYEKDTGLVALFDFFLKIKNSFFIRKNEDFFLLNAFQITGGGDIK